MKSFKLVRVMMGSGWPSGHVAVDWHHSWPNNTGGNEILLNGDTSTPQELIMEIDHLIEELQKLIKDVPHRFAQWRAAVKRKRAEGTG